MSKQKIGNILYWLSIGMLLAYVPILLSLGDVRAPMSDSDVGIWYILFAAAVAIHVVSNIMTGETGMRTVVVKREESPVFFKCLIVFYSSIAAALVITGINKLL